MSAALLAAIAGVLGITLGRVWDGRSEASRWRQDQTTASYQRLAEAFHLLYEEIRTIALMDPDAENFADVVSLVRRDKTWDNALAAVWLHGSPPVIRAASLLDRAVTELFYDGLARLFTIDDWNSSRMRTSKALEEFVVSARKELDLSYATIELFAVTPTDAQA